MQLLISNAELPFFFYPNRKHAISALTLLHLPLPGSCCYLKLALPCSCTLIFKKIVLNFPPSLFINYFSYRTASPTEENLILFVTLINHRMEKIPYHIKCANLNQNMDHVRVSFLHLMQAGCLEDKTTIDEILPPHRPEG